MPSYAPPHPWRADWSAAERSGLVPVRDANGQDVLYVDYDDKLRTQRTVAAVEALSDLVATYSSTNDANFRPILRDIALLDVAIVAFTAVGVTAGFVAVLS